MGIQRRECTKCNKNRDPKFFVGARGRVCSYCRKARTSGSSKDRRLMETYGITLEEYTEMYHSHDGRCWICKGKRPVLDVDHDHKLERAGVPPRQCVRGLLCRRCNRRLLPAATDSTDVLHNAIVYLQTAPAQYLLTLEED